MTSACVLAIDVGASTTKAAAYDLTGGVLGRAHVAHPLRTPMPGRVEQDPDVWWTAATDASRAALEQAQAAYRVDAIAVSSTNALVLIDRGGQPVRPAIMQLDDRSHREADRLRRDQGAVVARLTGGRVGATGYWLPVLAWLRRQEPDVLDSAASVLYPSGFLIHRMTGVPTIDVTRAATTLLLDKRSGKWSEALVREAGIRPSQLPTVVASRAVVGGLAPWPATRLGVPAGTPVVAGAMDSVAAALGLGMLRAGDAAVLLGTVSRVGLLAPPRRATRIDPSCPYPDSDLRWSMRPLWGAGRWLQWAVDTFRDGDWSAVGPVSRPADGDQLVAIPPWRADGGAIVGTGMDHGRAELTEAAILGVLAELADALRDLAAAEGQAPLRIGVCGPAAPLVADALAGLIGTRVQVPADPETESRGDAVLAAVGAGAFQDLRGAVAAMVPRLAVHEPVGDWTGYTARAAAARRRLRATTHHRAGRPHAETGPLALDGTAGRAHGAYRSPAPPSREDPAGRHDCAPQLPFLAVKEMP